MTFQHGRFTFISLAAVDLSPVTDASELGRKADKHDVTTYGKNSHVYDGGLKDGEASISGTYDTSTTAGPHHVIGPLVGTVVELIRRVEGTGSGKPQETVDVLVEEYTETNPVADMVKWSAKLQLSDDITNSTQT